jgi:calcium channel MID1
MSSTTTTLSSLPTLISASLADTAASAAYVIPAAVFPLGLSDKIYLTLSLCSLSDLSASYNASDFNAFTAYTNATYTYGSFIQGGYANITVYPLEEPQETTNIVFNRPDGSAGDIAYELGVTTSDPWSVLNKVPLFSYEDADNASALLTSPTYPSNLLEQAPVYEAFVVPTSQVREDLSNSTCYLRSLQRDTNTAVISQRNISTSTTKRGVVELALHEGGGINETDRGGERIQYTVSGLTPGTNYSVWGIQNDTITSGNNIASRLFTRQFFKTKTGNNCRLLFDVPFCPWLAHSVPAPPSLDTPSLLALFNATIAPSIFAFNTTLETFPCHAPLRKEQGMYSYVRTCDQCLDAYQSWLCGIRMPRCTDESSPTPEKSVDPDNLDETDIVTTFHRTSANNSRTPSLPDEAFPYYEIPPCIDTCHLVAASCPPVISNAFNCPLKTITLEQSYSYPYAKQIVFGNVQGGDDPSYLKRGIKEHGAATRAKDRFGNVRCNDMGSILLTTRRRWSGIGVTSNSPSRVLNARRVNAIVLWTLVIWLIV